MLLASYTQYHRVAEQLTDHYDTDRGELQFRWEQSTVHIKLSVPTQLIQLVTFVLFFPVNIAAYILLSFLLHMTHNIYV